MSTTSLRHWISIKAESGFCSFTVVNRQVVIPHINITIMYSNMCVKITLCLTFIVSINARVLTYHSVSLEPLYSKGIAVETTVEYKAEDYPPTSVPTYNIDDQDKKTNVVIPNSEEDIEEVASIEDFAPSFEDRHGVRVGHCPAGQVRRSGFCIDSDY